MPAHLRPPERRLSRPLGLLAIALGIAMLVFAAFSGRPAEEDTPQVVPSATEPSTEATVLGEDIERTTVAEAPPASAAGVTTTSTTTAGSGSDDPPGGTTALDTPSVTIGSPVSIVSPPPPRPTTTTTAPTTTTTTTTDPTSTTVVTTTTEA